MALWTPNGKILTRQPMNNNATLNLDNAFNGDFDEYFLRGKGITFQTDTSTSCDIVVGNAGVDDVGASDYGWGHALLFTNINASTALNHTGDAADLHIDVQGGDAAGNAAGEHWEFEMRILQPYSTSLFTYFKYRTLFHYSVTNYTLDRPGSGWMKTAKRHTDILLTPTNAFATGIFELFGVR